MVRAGTKAQVYAVEREDYLNGDWQATGDDGKPYMAIKTAYEDREDVLINAGLARAWMTS